MPNPILQALGQRSPNPNMMNAMNNARQIISVAKNSNNPIGMLNAMAYNNPTVRQAMQYVQACGGNAQQAFYNLAQQKGVNPDEILNMVR